MKRLNVCLCLMVLCTPAWAANFCVTNASELQAAFDVAENNGESDIIRVAEGTYTAPTGGFLFAPNIAGGVDESSDIEIIGGWTAFFENPCGVGPSTDPAGTVLSGGGLNRVMDVRLPQQGTVSIQNLTFINGFTPDLSQGAGLRVYAASSLGFSGRLTVQSNAFIANSGGFGSGLVIGLLNSDFSIQGTQTTNVQVINNLFAGNIARTGPAGAVLVRLATPLPQSGPVLDPRPALSLVSNTIVNNSSQASARGLILSSDGVTVITTGANLAVVNNNIWDNGDLDLEVFSDEDQNVSISYNNLGTVFQSVLADFYINNISVEPVYVSCGPFCIDRIPVGDSPLIDAGLAPSPFSSPWTLPDTDAAGDLRVRDARVDIGAYEGTSDRLFADRFED